MGLAMASSSLVDSFMIHMPAATQSDLLLARTGVTEGCLPKALLIDGLPVVPHVHDHPAAGGRFIEAPVELADV